MTQASAMPPAPMAASTHTPRTTQRRAATAAVASRGEEKMTLAACLLQGGAFIGFLLVLFVLAGFRG